MPGESDAGEILLRLKHLIPSSVTAEELLKVLLVHLKKTHSLPYDEISSLFSILGRNSEEVYLPVSVFNDNLSSLETIVKYLKEARGMHLTKIAALLNRNVQTVWTTYKKSTTKMPGLLTMKENEGYFIPLSKLRDRNLSTLEIIVSHLKQEYGLGFHDIALLLKRDDSTVWTVYRRAIQKEKKV